MDLIWLRSAWNAKTAAFSTYPPSCFLPPSFFHRLQAERTRLYGNSGKEGGNCAREEESQEKYKEERGEIMYNIRIRDGIKGPIRIISNELEYSNSISKFRFITLLESESH